MKPRIIDTYLAGKTMYVIWLGDETLSHHPTIEAAEAWLRERERLVAESAKADDAQH